MTDNIKPVQTYFISTLDIYSGKLTLFSRKAWSFSREKEKNNDLQKSEIEDNKHIITIVSTNQLSKYLSAVVTRSLEGSTNQV